MNKKLITTLVLSSLVASSFAVNAGAANDKQVLKDEKGTVHNVVGKLGKASGATAEDRALNALDNVAGDFGFAKANGTFKATKSVKADGTTHTYLNQMVNGVKVFGGEMIVHEANGEVTGVTGNFISVAPKANQAALSEAAAIEAAVASTGFTGELSRAATAELGYTADGTLAYVVNAAYLGDAPANWFITVNAVDGSIVESVNAIENVVGTGTGVKGDSKSINTTYRSPYYYLEDTSKTAMTGIIRTRDMRNGTSSIYNHTDSDNAWTATSQRSGVDAHYYAGVVYNWYYNNTGRNSINGSGGSIESLVRYGVNYNNAFWNGTYMVYGEGDGTTYRAFSAALDVVAHELTHGVTEKTSGLVYQNQSGALNESWSDAIGATIDSNDWLMGEDLRYDGQAFRSLSSPNTYGDPDHMSEYVNTTSDNGGVHTNSGIPNKAFYNFATAIGSRTIAGKIWHKAQSYMTSSTNFSGARAATISASQALYGSSYTTALQNAWSAVGVY